MNNEQLVTKEVAKLAHAKGFDWKLDNGEMLQTNMGENNRLEFMIIPTQTILQKWLREVHKIFIEVSVMYDLNSYRVDVFKTHDERVNSCCNFIKSNYELTYNSYEEAL